MARYAYCGKTTVESCQSIDVLHWNRLGYFRYSPWFCWVRTRDGERLAFVEIQHHSVILKCSSRSYGEDCWGDVAQRVPVAWTPCPFGGERPWFVCCAQSNAVSCGATAIGLRIRANRNRRAIAGSERHRKSACNWEGARTCLKNFRTSRNTCTGAPTIVCGALMHRRGHGR
jgi:hypothetical protein